MQTNAPSGALLINKHPGCTSFDIVREIKSLFKKYISPNPKDWPKIGHAGTLDPFASGLLVVLIGKGVKLSQYFLSSQKTYTAKMHFGVSNQAGDHSEPITAHSQNIPSNLELLNATAKNWLQRSNYLQTPPMHSAKKINGKRLYELARAGLEIERKPVSCKLYSFEFTEYETPYATFGVSCSAGTYIRKLSQDFAKELDSIALLTKLERTGSGNFQLENALSLDQLQSTLEQSSGQISLSSNFIPFDALLSGYRKIEISKKIKDDLFFGKIKSIQYSVNDAKITYNSLPSGVYHENRLIGVATPSENPDQWEIQKLFS